METQITDLFGLQIYTDKGMFIGEVEDVLIDVDQKKF
jgi:sporulation protein YlmC with PRC-barrel domain